MQLNAPVTLVSMTSRHDSSLMRQRAPSWAMPALLMRKWRPPSAGTGIGQEPVHLHRVAHVASSGVDPHSERGDGRLGEQRLLAHVPPREVHIAEGHVAAEPRELEADGPPKSGGTPGDHGHLARKAFGNGLWQGMLHGGDGCFGTGFPGLVGTARCHWHGTPKVRPGLGPGKLHCGP